jgi:membrane protease YdiL (CAAX protease family)
VLGLIAVVGLAVRGGGPLEALAPTSGLSESLIVGAAAGLASTFGLWLVRGVPPVRALQTFQQQLVREWTIGDAVAVSLLSGLAEEALLRALLQPMIGLIPAAVVFAALHFVPDRRLWLWPVVALGLGLVLGLLFERAGFPAAAAAHIVINLVALLRLRNHQTG